MEIWLRQGGEEIRVPVLPSSYEVTSGQMNTVVNINALGDINLIGNRGLMEISFSSFFPAADERYCEYTPIRSPMEYVSAIEKIKRGGTARLTITGTVINMMVTIENFQHGEEDGSGDITYTLECKEYRYLNAESEKTGGWIGGNAREMPPADETEEYLVKDGDCLSAIAMRMTGKPDWKPLYEQNKEIIGSNPNLIRPGQILTVSGVRKGT